MTMSSFKAPIPATTLSLLGKRGLGDVKSNSTKRSVDDSNEVKVALCEPDTQATLNSDCWERVGKYLSARDILALHQVLPLLSPGHTLPSWHYRNQVLTNVLVERYYSRDPKVQSSFRRAMTPILAHTHQNKTAFDQWMDNHLREKVQTWVRKDVLRQGALLRYLSNGTEITKTAVELPLQSGLVSSITLLSDGRVVSSGKTLKVWDLTKPVYFAAQEGVTHPF